MSNKKIDLLSDLLEGEEGILVQLRMGEGLDEEKFKCACSLVVLYNIKW